MVMQYCKSLVEVRLGGSTNNILEKVVGRGNLVRSSLFFVSVFGCHHRPNFSTLVL